MTPALFLAGMALLCVVACVAAVRAWRAVETRPLRPLEAVVARLAVVAVMALPLLADAGALPGPRSPSVGLPLTGGTMTGQVVFSGVSTDISTGTNEDLQLAPAGTGQVDITTPIKNSTGTTLDIREAITNGGTDTCNGVAGTNSEFCIMPQDAKGMMLTTATGQVFQRIWAKSGGSAFLQLVPAGTGNAGRIDFYTSAAAALAGSIGYNGSTAVDGDVADKLSIYSYSKKIMLARSDNAAAGTDAVEFTDNAAGTMAVLFAVDGNGAVRFRDMTSAHGATCNAGNEGLLYYRSISASNKSGFCVCAETSSGVYGWKMGMTFGSSALTDGDC